MDSGENQSKQLIPIVEARIVESTLVANGNLCHQHDLLKKKLQTENVAYLTEMFRIRNEENMVDKFFPTSGLV